MAERPFLLMPLTVLGCVMVLAVAGCAGAPEPSGGDESATDDSLTTPRAVVEPRDVDEAGQIALEAAKTHPEVNFPPFRATDAVPDRPRLPGRDEEMFRKHFFVYVWSDLGHLENSAFAVSRDGSVFKLPEEFAALALDEGLEIADEQELEVILRFYLDFHVVMPGIDELVVLEGVQDIPGIDSAHIARHEDVVRPLRARWQDRGWTLDFHAWQAVGGLLIHWQLEVSSAAEIEVAGMQVLDDQLGDYVTVE